MKEQKEREKRKKNKIIIFNSKKEFGKGSFNYDVPKKNLKFGTPHSSPYPQAYNFGLRSTLSWATLIGILYSPRWVISEFSSKT